MVPGPTPAERDRALAWLALSLADGISVRAARRLAAELGGPEAVLGASGAALERAAGTPAVARTIDAAAGRARAEMAALRRVGASLVAWDAAAYPRLLREIADPPLVLAVRGTLGADEPAVAVVGTRHPSEYGRRVTGELADGLARAGVVVVSGLATGIDAIAHGAALAAGGRTIAVLGTGIDRVYPSWHTALARDIVEAGALVSEFPCGTPPLAHHFPRRNRLISGLALGTVVVEAADRSGSLITAGCALDQGREVFAVPGPVGAARQRGPHRLIQQGAKLVETAADVLEEVAPALLAGLAAARAAAAVAELAPAERSVLEAVGQEGGQVDDVIRRTKLPAAATLEVLLALELRGLVEQAPGKQFRRRAA